MTMQKNAYGELMVRYVGNRWQYIDRNRESDVHSLSEKESPVSNQEHGAVDQATKMTRTMSGK
jgi:hypothetical protein